MFWGLLALACTAAPTDPLGPDGRSARDVLAQALDGREAAVVAAAAQAASAWEGKDAALDRHLGDALANVLMRPDEGMKLLRANPVPGDAAWTQAMLDAAMRSGQPATIDAVWAELGRPAVFSSHPVLDQVVQRARQDPALHYDLMEDVTSRCSLLDRQPKVGRRQLDLPALAELIPAARALGATQVVLGRAARRSDPDPVAGHGPWSCVSGVLLETKWPESVMRSMVIGATDGNFHIYLNLKIEAGHPWVYASNDAHSGARWLKAAELMKDAGPERGPERVQEVLGVGLRHR